MMRNVRSVWRSLAVWLVRELVGAEAVEPVPARIVYLEGSERQDASQTRQKSA
jgi:hypothetical protein